MRMRSAIAMRRHGRGVVVIFVLGVAALALPSVAAAHGRAMTVALDYRLQLDPGVARLSVFAFHRSFGLRYPALVDPSSQAGSFTRPGRPAR